MRNSKTSVAFISHNMMFFRRRRKTEKRMAWSSALDEHKFNKGTSCLFYTHTHTTADASAATGALCASRVACSSPTTLACVPIARADRARPCRPTACSTCPGTCDIRPMRWAAQPRAWRVTVAHTRCHAPCSQNVCCSTGRGAFASAWRHPLTTAARCRHISAWSCLSCPSSCHTCV